MKGYTIMEAIKNGVLKTGDILEVHIPAARRTLLGTYHNPIPTLDIEDNSRYPLNGGDLVVRINGIVYNKVL